MESFPFEESQLEIIPTRAFEGCGFITLELPAILQAIRGNAFKDCKNLTTLTISAQQIADADPLQIGAYAFSYNTNLKYIYSHALKAPENATGDAFEGNTGIELIIEEGATGYNVKPWNDFFNPEAPAVYDTKYIYYYLDENEEPYVEEITVGEPVNDYEPEPRTGWKFEGWKWPESVSGTKPDKMPNLDLEVYGYFTTEQVNDHVKYSLIKVSQVMAHLYNLT